MRREGLGFLLRFTALSACVLLGCTLLGCERTTERLIGSWRVDLEALNAQPIARLAAPPFGPVASELREAAYRDWRFTFYADESLEATLKGLSYQGRYVISRALSGTLYMRLEGAARVESRLDQRLGLPSVELPPLSERVVMRVKGERATLTFDDERSLPLRRAQTGI